MPPWLSLAGQGRRSMFALKPSPYHHISLALSSLTAATSPVRCCFSPPRLIVIFYNRQSPVAFRVRQRWGGSGFEGANGRLYKGRRLRAMGGGGGGHQVRPRRWAGVDDGVCNNESAAAVAMGGSGTEGADGRWVQEGVTARRASSPDDGQLPGGASTSAEAAGGRRRRCAGIGRCGGCGGGDGAAPRGGVVDGVVMERLRKGRRLRTMGGGGGGSPIRPMRAGRK